MKTIVKQVNIKDRTFRFILESQHDFDPDGWHLRLFDLNIYGAKCPPKLDYDHCKSYGKNLKFIKQHGIEIIIVGFAFSIEFYSKPQLGEKCDYCGKREYTLWSQQDKMCWRCHSFAEGMLQEELKKMGGKKTWKKEKQK